MKKITSLFLSIIMLFSITAGIDFSAYAAIYTGYCCTGEESTVSYSFDSETGVLKINGKGKMSNSSDSSASISLFDCNVSPTGKSETGSVTLWIYSVSCDL